VTFFLVEIINYPRFRTNIKSQNFWKNSQPAGCNKIVHVILAGQKNIFLFQIFYYEGETYKKGDFIRLSTDTSNPVNWEVIYEEDVPQEPGNEADQVN